MKARQQVRLDAAFPLGAFLGLGLSSDGAGSCTATATVTETFLNPHGAVHGGVLFILVDTAMGGATMSLLPSGQRCASIDVAIRYLRPVTSGVIKANATVLRPGRAVVQLEAKVTVADELVATAQGAFAVIQP